MASGHFVARIATLAK